jgi:PAS domain S-box-containing protein
MNDLPEPGMLLGGLRAAVTIADEEFRIVFMNDLAIEHYGYGGGAALIGTNLLDCHNPESQTELHQMYSRYRAGDLYPTRHREKTGNGLWKSAIFIPVVVKGRFQGVAELMWTERADLVFEE